MNKSKKAKHLRETSRKEAFKGFAGFNKKTLNEAVVASFARKMAKFPLTPNEVAEYIAKKKEAELEKEKTTYEN